MRRRRDILYSCAGDADRPPIGGMVGGRNMAEVPCAGTGEKSIEKGDATVILIQSLEAPKWPCKSPTTRPTTPSPGRISRHCWKCRATAAAPMPSTASFPPPTTISGTLWTRTISTTTCRSTCPRRRSCHSTRWSSSRARSPIGSTQARRSGSPTTSCTGRSRTCSTASRARCRCRPASATSCSTPAPRNMPPTRRARRRAMSRASPATSSSAGATRCRLARPSPPCSPTW